MSLMLCALDALGSSAVFFLFFPPRPTPSGFGVGGDQPALARAYSQHRGSTPPQVKNMSESHTHTPLSPPSSHTGTHSQMRLRSSFLTSDPKCSIFRTRTINPLGSLLQTCRSHPVRVVSGLGCVLSCHTTGLRLIVLVANVVYFPKLHVTEEVSLYMCLALGPQVVPG